jgi:hypothetical protein
MKVVLTQKLADSMDGVDVSNREVGDVIDLPSHEANILIAEGWVIRDRRGEPMGAPAIERRQYARSSGVATQEQSLNTAS